MTTLQEYLNDLKNKEQVKEINLEKITEERKSQNLTDLLEGGELDLREFKNLEEIEINPNLLKNPLTKVNVNGLTNLKEFDWSGGEKIETDTEEDKKLWEELGITEDNKKKLVREIKRLVGLFATQKLTSKKANVYFATEKAPKEQLKDKAVFSEFKNDILDIYLQLDKKDKNGNFSSSLVLWSLSQELISPIIVRYDKNPLFWQHYWGEEFKWIKENIGGNYRKELELLSLPSTFPYKSLEMKDILAVYYPSSEENKEFLSSKTTVGQEIVDQVWEKIWSKVMKVIDEELKNNPDEEKKKDLSVRVLIDRISEQENEIKVNYHPQNPLQRKIRELILIVPLKQEIENLKKKKDQSPSPENYHKLTNQIQELQRHLRNLIGTGKKYQEIQEKISKID